jgi:hypothetical protein
MSVHSDTNTDYTFIVWTNPAIFASKTQMFLSFWLKVGTWPTGADNLVGFLKTDFSTGGWAIQQISGTDTLKMTWYGTGTFNLADCIPAPIAGQGWIHCGFHFTTIGTDTFRAYKNGTLTGTLAHDLTGALTSVGDFQGASNHTSVKIAEPAVWVAADGSLDSTLAQTLATALAAGALPSETTRVADWYAPCRSDLVTVIG